MKKNLPVSSSFLLPQSASPYFSFFFRNHLENWLVAAFFSIISSIGFGQNAIVGAGFAPGWGGACGTNTDFQYFSASAGSSWIRTTVANGAGNQFFRLGVDWDGQNRHHTLTPGEDVQVQPGTEYTLNANCNTSGAMFINVTDAAHQYIFKTFNATATPQYRMVIFKVEGAIRTITGVSVPGTVFAGSPAQITATLNDPLAVGQGVYLRYTTDAFATSTVVAMSGAGNQYSANIPALVQGTQVTYYCFTSGSGLGAQINHGNADFYTINLNGNEGLNYTYTVQAPVAIGTIADGNWTNPNTWEGGLVPNGALAMAMIRHNVTLDNSSQTVRTLTIEPAGTLNMGSQTLTLSPNSVINQGGTFNAGTGRVRFMDFGSITGNPINLYDLEIAGAINMATQTTVGNMLEIKSGGSLVAGSLLSYGPASTLYINTGGNYNAGNEWTLTLSPHHVEIGVGSNYVLCSSVATAAFKAKGNLTVKTGGQFTADPLCMGNSPMPPGFSTALNFLTIGQNLTIEAGSSFVFSNGDVGSLSDGTRFHLMVMGNLNNAGTFTLNNDIGDDLYLHGNWTNTGIFNPGSNNSAGLNPVTDKDGRAVFLVGTQAQTINGNPTDFHYLIVINAAGITANTSFTVSRGLALTAGKLNLNGHTLNLGTYYTNEANGISYTLGRLYGSSYLSYTYGGNFVRFISKQNQPNADDEQVAPNLGEPYIFPVGSSTDYRPYTVTYSAFPNVETLLNVRHVAGAGIVTGPQPNLTDADGLNITQYFADAYWDVNTRTQVNGTFDVSYTCNNCNIGLSNLDKIRAIRRVNDIGEWSAPGDIIITTGSNESPTVGRSGLTAFSQFGLGFNPVVLPVRLKTFTGIRSTSGNLLSWTSSSEVNFSHYELQRSADSRNWSSIARIDGMGGQTERSYSHTDQKATGLIYYRLNMVDKDGSNRYSHIVSLKGTEPDKAMITAVYQPGSLRILLSHRGTGFTQGSQARITDINGRVLTQQALGDATVQYLNTGYLPKGVYLVQVQQAMEQETIKVWVY
jgi:hypothetical protein